MADTLSPEDKKYLEKVFIDNLPEDRKPKAIKDMKACDCGGCTCPSGSGAICDGGTYVGTAGGFYGATTG